MSHDYVCADCFYSYRSDIHFKGCDHVTNSNIYYTWNSVSNICETTAASSRPFPANHPPSLHCFKMCDPRKNICKRDKCTYAHGKDECDKWNEELRRSKSEANTSPLKKPKLDCDIDSGESSMKSSLKKEIALLTERIASNGKKITDKAEEIAQKEKQIIHKQIEIADQRKEITEREKESAADKMLLEDKKQLSEKIKWLSEDKKELSMDKKRLNKLTKQLACVLKFLHPGEEVM